MGVRRLGVDEEVVPTGFLLGVLHRVELVDARAVVEGVASECDLQRLEELVDAGE